MSATTREHQPMPENDATQPDATQPEDKGDEAKAEHTEQPSEAADTTDDAKAEDKPDAKAEASEAADTPAIPDVEMPEVLDDLDEAALRAKWNELAENRAARLEAVVDGPTAEAYELVVLAQRRITDELATRIEQAKDTAAKVEQVKALEVPDLPEESIPSPVKAATRAAAADAPKAPDTKPVLASAQDRERPKSSFVAAAGRRGGARDVVFNDLVAEASRCGEGETILASVEGFDAMAAADKDALPEPLTWSNIDRNDELINESRAAWRARERMRAGEESEDLARTAAICDPLDIIRDISDDFTDEERVAPVFPSRPAGRLGFQFTQSANLSDVSSGAGVWTETDQAAVNPAGGQEATWKKIVDFTCGTPQSVRALAVYFAARYDITLEMSNPERLANLKNALSAARARVKEGRVLSLLDATLGRNLYEQPVGAIPAFTSMLANLIAEATDFNRLSDPSFTVVLPPGFTAALIGDEARRQFHDTGDVGDVLAEARAVNGVSNVVQALDGTDLGIGQPGYPLPVPRVPADAPGYLPNLSGYTFRVRVFDPSDYLYAETGEMNAGVYRSTNEIRQNKAVLFGEEFLMLAKQGPQRGQYVDITLCETGRRATGYDPGDCSAAAVT